MHTRQGNTLQSLRAVQAFLDINSDRLAGVAQSGIRHRLDRKIEALTGYVIAQSATNLESLGSTRKLRALRKALLRDHMTPIARIARAAATRLSPVPELDPFRMPSVKLGTYRLAAVARGMAEAAAPFAEVFVDYGLEVDFVRRLHEAVEAMVACGTDRTQARGRRGGATKGLQYDLSAGRKIVRALDALVRSALKDDAALLASWNLVKRVHRGTGRSRQAPTSVQNVESTARVRIVA